MKAYYVESLYGIEVTAQAGYVRVKMNANEKVLTVIEMSYVLELLKKADQLAKRLKKEETKKHV
jgi:hypothetical protein